MSIVARYRPEVKKLQDAISALIPKDGNIFESPHSDTIVLLSEKIRSYKLKPVKKRPMGRSEALNINLMNYYKTWLSYGFWSAAFKNELDVLNEIKWSPVLHKYAYNCFVIVNKPPTTFPLEANLIKHYEYVDIIKVKLATVINSNNRYITCPSDYSTTEFFVGKHNKKSLYGNKCKTILGAKRSIENKIKKMVNDAINKS